MPISVSTTGRIDPDELIRQQLNDKADAYAFALIRESPVKTGLLRRSWRVASVTYDRIRIEGVHYFPYPNIRGRSAGYIQRALRSVT